MVAKKPNSKRNLDMAIRRMGEGDLEFARRRAAIANAIVASMMPEGAVKGGSALKIRFGDCATRATTDLDAAREHDLDGFVEALSERLTAGWEGFTGRIVVETPAHPKGVPTPYVMRPFSLKLSYNGTPWYTVQFELGHNEIGDAEDPDMVVPAFANDMLEAMGFSTLPPVPLMGLHHQIAQKLHGATEPNSKRAHDLIDLQVIMARGDVDLAKTRAACERLFAYRQMQAWPAKVNKGENWAEAYAQQLLGQPVLQDVDDAIEWANNLITKIAESE